MASVETRLNSQLSKREQEMIALQARMQASYQDHVAQTQRLNAKVCSYVQVFQYINVQLRFYHFQLVWVPPLVRSPACKTNWKRAPVLSLLDFSKRTPFSVMPSIKPLVRLRASESFPVKVNEK